MIILVSYNKLCIITYYNVINMYMYVKCEHVLVKQQLYTYIYILYILRHTKKLFIHLLYIILYIISCLHTGNVYYESDLTQTR